MFHTAYETERRMRELPATRQAEAENERMARMARANVETGRKQETASRKTLRAGNLPSRLTQLLRTYLRTQS